MSETLVIALITGIVTFLAATAPKWLEQRSGARKQKADEHAAIRDDLRKIIADRDAAIADRDGKVAERDQTIERWRDRYYTLRERHLNMQTRYSALVLILRANSLDHLVANINAPLEGQGLDEDEDPPALEDKEARK